METLVNQIIEGLKPTVKEAIRELMTGNPKEGPETDLISVHRASDLTGGRLSVSTLYIKHSKGQLPPDVAFKKAGRLWFSKKALLKWLSPDHDIEQV